MKMRKNRVQRRVAILAYLLFEAASIFEMLEDKDDALIREEFDNIGVGSDPSLLAALRWLDTIIDEYKKMD